MRFIISAVLAAHGVAHLVGVIASWNLAPLPELPYKTTIVAGRFNVGDNGMRVMGLLWLCAAIAFLLAAGAVAVQSGSAVRVTAVAVMASLLLCIAGLPDARIGVAVNAVLAIAIATAVGLKVPTFAP